MSQPDHRTRASAARSFRLVDRTVPRWFDALIIVLLLIAAVQDWVGSEQPAGSRCR